MGSCRVTPRTPDPLPEEGEVAAGFEAARSRIQGLVARRVQSRNTPELRFRPDPVASQAARVEDLIRRVRADERGGGTGDPDERGTGTPEES